MCKIPTHLSHRPIIGVDYGKIDNAAGAGDAQFLSLGEATWNKYYESSDYSAKVFRVTENGNWSRQSEELPLWRVLDMAILISSRIYKKDCYLNPQPIDGVTEDKLKKLDAFIDKKRSVLDKRVEELRRVIDNEETQSKLVQQQKGIQDIVSYLKQLKDARERLADIEDELNQYPNNGYLMNKSLDMNLRKARNLLREVKEELGVYDEGSGLETMFPNGYNEEDFDVDDFYDRD